jgi:hypothetical protein
MSRWSAARSKPARPIAIAIAVHTSARPRLSCGNVPFCVIAASSTAVSPVGAGNRVTAVELVFSPGPGLGKFGIWLRGSRAL